MTDKDLHADPVDVIEVSDNSLLEIVSFQYVTIYN